MTMTNQSPQEPIQKDRVIHLVSGTCKSTTLLIFTHDIRRTSGDKTPHTLTDGIGSGIKPHIPQHIVAEPQTCRGRATNRGDKTPQSSATNIPERSREMYMPYPIAAGVSINSTPPKGDLQITPRSSRQPACIRERSTESDRTAIYQAHFEKESRD